MTILDSVTPPISPLIIAILALVTTNSTRRVVIARFALVMAPPTTRHCERSEAIQCSASTTPDFVALTNASWIATASDLTMTRWPWYPLWATTSFRGALVQTSLFWTELSLSRSAGTFWKIAFLSMAEPTQQLKTDR